MLISFFREYNEDKCSKCEHYNHRFKYCHKTLQAKPWKRESTVSGPDIQTFTGSLVGALTILGEVTGTGNSSLNPLPLEEEIN